MEQDLPKPSLNENTTVQPIHNKDNIITFISPLIKTNRLSILLILIVIMLIIFLISVYLYMNLAKTLNKNSNPDINIQSLTSPPVIPTPTIQHYIDHYYVTYNDNGKVIELADLSAMEGFCPYIKIWGDYFVKYQSGDIKLYNLKNHQEREIKAMDYLDSISCHLSEQKLIISNNELYIDISAAKSTSGLFYLSTPSSVRPQKIPKVFEVKGIVNDKFVVNCFTDEKKYSGGTCIFDPKTKQTNEVTKTISGSIWDNIYLGSTSTDLYFAKIIKTIFNPPVYGNFFSVPLNDLTINREIFTGSTIPNDLISYYPNFEKHKIYFRGKNFYEFNIDNEKIKTFNFPNNLQICTSGHPPFLGEISEKNILCFSDGIGEAPVENCYAFDILNEKFIDYNTNCYSDDIVLGYRKKYQLPQDFTISKY